MESNKNKQQAVKMAKEDEKKTYMVLNESKKAFDALWMAKICFHVGEALHNLIKSHPPIQLGKQ